MSQLVSVYIVSAPEADRPMVSPTMSRGRLASAKQKGWTVNRATFLVTTSGVAVLDTCVVIRPAIANS